MSCPNSGCGCGCDPCQAPAPVNSSYETLSSALDNFILYFYGTITKTVVDGVVVWTLPCDLATGIPGYPRDPAIGTACYFKELFEAFDLRISNAEGSTAAALAIANQAQIAAEAASAQFATLGTIATQDADDVNISGGIIDGADITGVDIPVNPTDAVNKQYADSIAGGVTPKPAVRLLADSNLDLAGFFSSVDGVTMAAGNRVLLKGQIDPAYNGIYTVAGPSPGLFTLDRSTDSDTAPELALNNIYFVSEGAVYAGTSRFISTAPTVLDTDPIKFSQYSAASTYSAGPGLQLSGTQFSIDNSIVMRRSQNLADVANVAAARANLGVSGSGNDPAYNLKSANLSDVASVATARTNLGVSATGLDGNYLLKTSNLGDVANVATSRTNLGVAAIGADTNYAFRANNLSDLPSANTARINLGLGSMAIQPASNVAITGGTVKDLSELRVNYGIFTSPIAALDSATGGLYLGFTPGSYGIIRSVLDNSSAAAPIAVILGNTQTLAFDTSGITLQPNYGIAVSGTGKVTQAAAPTAGPDLCNKTYVDSVSAGGGARINVKNYGAVGNGSTNDTAAINLAIAAMTNYSTLYFPAGTYLVTPGGITEFASLSHIAVIGDGHSSRITSTATGAPGNFLVVHSSCQFVTMRDFAIIGAATVRGSGIGIRMYASDSFISNIYIFGTSDFGLMISNDAGGYTSRVIVSDCVSDHTLGDGFHFGYVTDSGIYNCQAYYTSDDGLGIGDDGATGFPPARIEVVGFISIQAGYLVGHGSGIRIFDGATDIHIIGGQIKESQEAGLQTTRATSTTAYCARIQVNGLKVYSCLQTAGMYANISIAFANQVSLEGCWSESPVSQCCFAFLDCNDLTVIGCTGKNAVVRTFVTDDGTTTNVAATWSNWVFSGNVSLGTPSNESFYFVPATGKAIANLVLNGNTDVNGTATNYIATNRLATAAKIMNNISLGGKSITNGGSGISPTLANNN